MNKIDKSQLVRIIAVEADRGGLLHNVVDRCARKDAVGRTSKVDRAAIHAAYDELVSLGLVKCDRNGNMGPGDNLWRVTDGFDPDRMSWGYWLTYMPDGKIIRQE